MEPGEAWGWGKLGELGKGVCLAIQTLHQELPHHHEFAVGLAKDSLVLGSPVEISPKVQTFRKRGGAAGTEQDRAMPGRHPA